MSMNGYYHQATHMSVIQSNGIWIHIFIREMNIVIDLDNLL